VDEIKGRTASDGVGDHADVDVFYGILDDLLKLDFLLDAQ